jgi:hypothetical protein
MQVDACIDRVTRRNPFQIRHEARLKLLTIFWPLFLDCL